MLNPTLETLRRLRLLGMAKALEAPLLDPDSAGLTAPGCRSRTGSPCWSIAKRWSGRTPPWRSDCAAPACARRRAWRISTSTRPAGSTGR